MKREAEYALHGPAYAPSARERAHEYRPRYPVGYVPRAEPAVTMAAKPWMLRRGTPSPIHDLTEAEQRRAQARRANKPRSRPREQKVLAVLGQAPRALAAGEIAAVAGLESNRVNRALARAVADGRVIAELLPGAQRRRAYRLAKVAEDVGTEVPS